MDLNTEVVHITIIHPKDLEFEIAVWQGSK